MRELDARTARLERDLEHTYLPALRRLMSAREPGAEEVLNELEDRAAACFLEALEWLRLDLRGLVFAGGDPELYAYWRYELSRRESDEGRRSMVAIFRDIAEEERDPVAELERFRRGQAKAAGR